MTSIAWTDEATAAIEQLRNDGNLTADYVICTLEDPKKNPKMALASPDHAGKGGRDRIEEILSSDDVSDKVMTGAFLATAVDERGSVVSTRRKYIHVLWVGPSVGIMIKGKVNSMSGAFRDPFPGSALYLQLMGDLDDLKAAKLETDLLAAGGAHKPTRYDFTNGTLTGTTTPSSSPTKASTPNIEELHVSDDAVKSDDGGEGEEQQEPKDEAEQQEPKDEEGDEAEQEEPKDEDGDEQQEPKDEE